MESDLLLLFVEFFCYLFTVTDACSHVRIRIGLSDFNYILGWFCFMCNGRPTLVKLT